MTPAIVSLALNLALAASPAAQPAAPAAQERPPAAASSAAPAVHGDCEVRLDQAEMLKAMAELVGDDVGGWVEYAPAKGDKVDLSTAFRFSFIKDSATGGVTVEMWLDKLGQSAVRVRPLPGGGVANEMRQGDSVYLIPEKKEGEDGGPAKSAEFRKATCELRKIIAGKIRESTTAGKSRVRMQTAAGTFDCVPVTLATQKGSIVVYFSEQAPVLKVAGISMPDGNAFQLAASGRGAYSSFPPGVTPISLERLLGALRNVTDEVDAEKKRADLRKSLDAKGEGKEEAAIPPSGEEGEGVLYGKGSADDQAKVDVTRVR